MSRRGAAATKIVVIETRYIETDATSFKSVVQRLTGKDSKMETTMEPEPAEEVKAQKMYLLASPLASISNKASANIGPFMSRGMSFKDLEWLLDVELPPLNEELYQLLAN